LLNSSISINPQCITSINCDLQHQI